MIRQYFLNKRIYVSSFETRSFKIFWRFCIKVAVGMFWIQTPYQFTIKTKFSKSDIYFYTLFENFILIVNWYGAQIQNMPTAPLMQNFQKMCKNKYHLAQSQTLLSKSVK